MGLVRLLNISCYFVSCTDVDVLVLWWLICFKISVTESEDRSRYSSFPSPCALCVVKMEQCE